MAAIIAKSIHPATTSPDTTLEAPPLKANTLLDAGPEVLVADDVVRYVVLGAVVPGPLDVVSSPPPGMAVPAESEVAAVESASVVDGFRAELGDNAAAGAVAPVGRGATVGDGGVEIAKTVAPSR